MLHAADWTAGAIMLDMRRARAAYVRRLAVHGGRVNRAAEAVPGLRHTTGRSTIVRHYGGVRAVAVKRHVVAPATAEEIWADAGVKRSDVRAAKAIIAKLAI